MEFVRKRWFGLYAAMVCALFSGAVHSWSVYVNPLMDRYGWTAAAISGAYTLHTLSTAITPLLIRRLRSRMSLSTYCLIGGVLYSAGFMLCGSIQGSVLELYLYFGLLAGGGVGFIYLSLGTYVVQLFPDRRGLAAGLFTACFGLSAFFWALAARAIMSSTGSVSTAFFSLGLIFLCVLLIATRFLCEVPSDWETSAPAGRSAVARVRPLSERSPGEVARSPLYYLLLCVFCCGLISGSMILSLGAPIVESVLGYSPEQAALVVGCFAIASTGGRLVWGSISDRIGRTTVLVILCGIICLAMIGLSSITSEVLFLACLLATPMCYGAYAATLSPITVETFGSRHFGINFNLMFIAFSLAALIGPQITAQVKQASGSYQDAFFYATLLGLAGMIGALIFRRIDRTRRAVMAGS